jgi:hypothetical protein
MIKEKSKCCNKEKEEKVCECNEKFCFKGKEKFCAKCCLPFFPQPKLEEPAYIGGADLYPKENEIYQDYETLKKMAKADVVKEVVEVIEGMKKTKENGDCICGAMAIYNEETRQGMCWGQCKGAYNLALDDIKSKLLGE